MSRPVQLKRVLRKPTHLTSSRWLVTSHGPLPYVYSFMATQTSTLFKMHSHVGLIRGKPGAARDCQYFVAGSGREARMPGERAAGVLRQRRARLLLEQPLLNAARDHPVRLAS